MKLKNSSGLSFLRALTVTVGRITVNVQDNLRERENLTRLSMPIVRGVNAQLLVRTRQGSHSAPVGFFVSFLHRTEE